MTAFPLDDYLARVGYRGIAKADLATLTALHRAHVDAIPFENLEIQMGGAVTLDAEALEAKMVAGDGAGTASNRTVCSPRRSGRSGSCWKPARRACARTLPA